VAYYATACLCQVHAAKEELRRRSQEACAQAGQVRIILSYLTPEAD
jgi:hypothetical protein